MADQKISALTSATTPLAGTEVLPIVQGGATVKVSVDNLTTGKNVSASQFNATSSITAQSTNGIINSKGTTGWAGVWHENTGGSLFVGADDSTGATFGTEAYGSVLSSATKPVYMRINSTNTFKFDTSGNLIPITAAKGINFTANTPAAGMTSQLLNWYEEGTWTPTCSGVTLTVNSATYTRIGRQVSLAFDITWPSTANSSNITVASFPFSSVANSGSLAVGYTDATYKPNGSSSGTGVVFFGKGGVPSTIFTNADLSGKRVIASIVYMTT